jgi:hypothetical protein
VPDADLVPVGAQVLAPAEAALAPPAAEHRVPGDPAAQPRTVHIGPDRADHAGPLVPDADRVGRLTGVQVGHLAGEELRVGAAHPAPLDVDDDLARPGDRRRHVAYLGTPGTGDDEGTHPATPEFIVLVTSRMTILLSTYLWLACVTFP